MQSNNSLSQSSSQNLLPPSAILQLPDYYEYVSALSFHPTLPLLAGSDGYVRIVVYCIG